MEAEYLVMYIILISSDNILVVEKTGDAPAIRLEFGPICGSMKRLYLVVSIGADD